MWHYQFTPHDLWDWDATQTSVLVDAQWQGQPRPLMLHANRNGFFYVFDRRDGALLLAKPFVRNLTWASGIGADGRPLKLPDQEPTAAGTKVCPSQDGATNWYAPSFNPATGLYYLQTVKWISERPLHAGLVNLDPRLGFNSIWFVVSALLQHPLVRESSTFANLLPMTFAAADIPFQQKGKKAQAEFDFIGQVLGGKSKVVSVVRDTIRVDLDAGSFKRLTNGDIQYNTGFYLKPGKYDFYFLDNKNNPALLQYSVQFTGENTPRTERYVLITPSADERGKMEQALAARKAYTTYGIHFDFDKASIRNDSVPLLRQIATALQNNPLWTLSITGHTDSIGDNAYNMKLSQARANSVRAILVKLGVSPARLTTAGAGPSQPIATNKTLQGRALNRRVVLARTDR